MTSQLSSQFSAQSTAEEIIAGHDLRGKTVVITGTSAGLGSETARVFAKAGAHVVAAARDARKNALALDVIRAQTADAKLEHITLDLSDLRSVRTAAAQILAAHPRIDILINNAAVMACPLTRTTEGCELQFGTNHIGHFALTLALMPALKAAAPARIVNLSSNGHQVSGLDFDDPHFQRREYSKWIAYGQAKTANILFGVGLKQRYLQHGITANAVHPGAILTELGRHLENADIEAMMATWKNAGAIDFKTVPQGAATSVWAALAPELDNIGGAYLEDCRIGQPVTTLSMTGYRPHAIDPMAANRLWELSEAICQNAA